MKKRFETPELIIVVFAEEDIITYSGPGGIGGNGEEGDDEEGGQLSSSFTVDLTLKADLSLPFLYACAIK